MPNAAEQYFNSFDPAEQERIRQSWGGADLIGDWHNNAVAAGATPAGGYPQGAPTTQAQAQQYASGQGWSEDFMRPEFSDPTIQRWAPYFDSASGKYRSMRGAEGLYEKPQECPPGMVPSGPNETDPCVNSGGAGAGGGGGYAGAGSGSAGWGAGTAGAVPQFNAPTFTPPTWQTALDDPGYQFSLNQGIGGLEKSAAARGTLRTGGTLKDIVDYGQDRAAQQYGDVYNRAANTFGLNYQGAKDEFAPQYGGWQTQYGGDLSRWTTDQNNALSRWQTQFGGDLSKYLQREGNIYGLINQPPPAPPVWA